MDKRLRSSEVRIGLGLMVIALLAFTVWPGPPQLPDAEVSIEAGGGVALPTDEEVGVVVDSGPTPGSTTAPHDNDEADGSTPSPTPDADEATPTPTPDADEATPEPTEQTVTSSDRVALELCSSISGSTCQGPIDRIGSGVGSFVALVHMRPARAGDVIQASLVGSAVTVEGGSFRFSNSGTGYYYSTFAVGNLPPGEYTVVVTLNGSEAVRTQLVRE